MADLLDKIREHFDMFRVQLVTKQLTDIERTSSYDDFERSGKFCYEELKRCGFSNVELFSCDADGKNTVFDCVMPQAWSLDHDRRSVLQVVGDDLPECGRILADSRENPLHANIWSEPTPDGGITAELVDFDSLEAGNYAAAKGKWVFYTDEPDVEKPGLMYDLYHKLAQAGIAGLVVSDLRHMDTMPYDFNWCNGLGYCGWYLTAGEKHLPLFSVSGLVGTALKRKLAVGKLTVCGELYCRIYDGKINTVTATIPGESKEEVALFAHLYEPFYNDDGSGFAFLCELGRQLIERKVRLKKTLRLVFSMELFGLAQYLKKAAHNIVLAANADGIAFMGCDRILLRRTPFFRSSFCDFVMNDTMAGRLPDSVLVPEKASLSDDTFCCNQYFGDHGIPTFWIHNDFRAGTHHSTGFCFAPDWKAASEQLPVICEVVEKLLIPENMEKYPARVEKEFAAQVKAILKDKNLTPFVQKMYIQAEFMRASGQLASLKDFCGLEVDGGKLAAIRKKAEDAVDKFPPEEFSAAEYKALNMIVSDCGHGWPFSLARVPLDKREPVKFLDLTIWSLFDGKRNLLECIRMAEVEKFRPYSEADITAIIKDLRYVAEYGYAKITPAVKVTPAEFGDALRKLGVVKGMKLIVHSTFSSLGSIDGKVEDFCIELQNAVGKEGILLMPAFTFQVYADKEPLFDVARSPADTGILTETFRKMPDVHRSFDPCHSYSAWGRDAGRVVAGHHLVPTIDPVASPLGILHKEGGFVLTVSSASSVTFMHLVEDMEGAKCCTRRGEEYDTILPDGSKVLTRTWGWRQETCRECPSKRTGEIFALIRKSGQLREVMLNNAHLMLFPLESYRQAFAKLMKKHCRNKAVPRKNRHTVKSDWNNRKRQLKAGTAAYTGEWSTVEK